MNLRATKLVRLSSVRQISVNASPTWLTAILCAVIFVLGVSQIEPRDPRSGVVDAENHGICDRTEQVQTEIISRIAGNPTCDLITETQLNDFNGSSGRLLLANKEIDSLKVGDFAGLTSIREIHLNLNSITELPSGLFDGLSSLEDLRLQDNKLTALQQGVFSDLADSPNLDSLRLENNEISTIETGAFQGVVFSTSARSRELHLYGNKLSTLQSGAFEGLANVTSLRLQDNQISTIEDGVFDGFTSLVTLDLANNQLVSLPPGLFEHTTALATLVLRNNKLSSLDAHIFRTLTVLTTLELNDNELATLPMEIFVNEFPNQVVQHMNRLRTLLLQDNRLSSLPDGIFSGLTELSGLPALETLDLGDNELSDLPVELFPLRRQLCTLSGFDISGNNFATAPTKEIDGVTYGLFDAPSARCAREPDTLVDLRINGLPLTDSDLEKIRTNYRALRRVHIADTGVSAAAIREFIEATANHNIGTSRVLGELDISGNDLSSWTSAEIQTLTSVIDFGIQVLRMANTQINAETVLLILEGLDDNTQTLDFSDNDLSGLNDSAAHTRLATALIALTKRDHLFLRNTKIDSDTALVIMQNVTTLIQSLSLAGNDLSGWNSYDADADPPNDLAAAFLRLQGASANVTWKLMDFSNTRIDSNAAASIIPGLRRLGGSRFIIPGVDVIELDLSGNQLTTLDPAWFEAWHHAPFPQFPPALHILDLSNNKLTEASPETFVPLAEYLETLHLIGNPIDPMPVEQEYFDVLPALKQLTYTMPEPPTPEPEVEKLGDNLARVLRIEASISGITIGSGGQVRLDVNVYGRQDILDNSLADLVTINWSDDGAGGSFSGSRGRQVMYTAPERPGTLTVYVSVDQSQCYGFQSQCSTEFKITVLRSVAAVEPTPVPVNPAGSIPMILTDSDGNQYEVFTPEGGGTFTGDTSSLKAGPGVVPNGEIVGLRIAEGGSASNDGKTYQRYSLGGNWYEISAVDASRNNVSSYGLNDALDVCIPLPDALRSNISDLAIVAINADDSLTVQSSRVRISAAAGARVCGNLRSVPATVAVGTAGSPAPLPTEVPDSGDASGLPETGGAAPSDHGMLWALVLGLAIMVSGFAVLRAARRRTMQMR